MIKLQEQEFNCTAIAMQSW